MLDPTALTGAIKSGLAKDRAALKSGGMGTASYTQAAQASAPMTPRFSGAGAPPRAPAPTGVVTGIEPGSAPARTWTDPAGATRRAVAIDPKYQTPGAAAEGTSVATQGGPNQWLHDLKAAHPGIFESAEHPENVAFREAFAKANNDPAKALEIANQLRDERNKPTGKKIGEAIAGAPAAIAAPFKAVGEFMGNVRQGFTGKSKEQLAAEDAEARKRLPDFTTNPATAGYTKPSAY